MSAPIVVLADLDESYLFPLMLKLAEQFPSDTKLNVFTRRDRYAAFFSTQRTVDLLIVDERMNDVDLRHHSIKHIIVLTENSEQRLNQPNIVLFYRFSTLQTLLHLISSYQIDAENQTTKDTTKIIAVTSAVGGVGKTTLAMALTISLNFAHQKALYIDAEWFQGFSAYRNNCYTLTLDEQKKLMLTDGKDYSVIAALIHSDKQFCYVPPGPLPLLSFNKNLKLYLNMIQTVAAAGDYRYIIVDSDSVFNASKAQLMSMCTQLLMVTDQRVAALYKLGQMIKHININPQLCHYIAFKVGAATRHTTALPNGGQITYAALIPFLSADESTIVEQISMRSDLQALTYLLM